MPASLDKFSVTLEKIFYDIRSQVSKLGIQQSDFYEMSKEEIYKLIPWKFVKISVASDLGKAGSGWGKDLSNGKLKGDELQGGYPDLYEGDEEEKEQKWKEAIAEAYTSQKLAGRVPGNLKRLVDRLLQPQVNWKTLLRQALITGLGRTVVTSWRRPSRKTPEKHHVFRSESEKTFNVPRDSQIYDSCSMASRRYFRLDRR